MPYATASRSFLLPGVDYTSLACISMSDLQQGAEYTSPASDIGLNIVGATVPDVAIYPELERFLWVNPSTGEINFYDGTAWRPATAAASIADGTLSLAKLDVSGELAYGILRVNSSSTAVEVVAFSSLIADGSIGLSKITPSASNGVMVVTDSGTVQWMSYSTFFNTMLSSATFPITQLSKGPSGATVTYLTTNAAGTVVSWATLDIVGGIGTGTLPIDKLAAGTDTYILTMVGTTPTWAAPTVYPISKEVQSLGVAIPAAGAKATIDITALGGMPKRTQLNLRCTAVGGDGEFAEDDIIDCSTAVQNTTTGDHAFTMYSRGTNSYIISQAGTFTPGVYQPSDGTTYNIDTSKWVIDFYAWA